MSNTARFRDNVRSCRAGSIGLIQRKMKPPTKHETGGNMRAIKIDPYSKTITEIDISGQSEFVTIIGGDRLVLTPLDRGINLLSGEDDETKPGFGFYGLPGLKLYGVAVVVWRKQEETEAVA